MNDDTRLDCIDMGDDSSEKALPIVIVPDVTYIDDRGRLTATGVIIIKDPEMFAKMQELLKAWGKEPIGIPGTRNGVEG